jgi:hypothetical protein
MPESNRPTNVPSPGAEREASDAASSTRAMRPPADPGPTGFLAGVRRFGSFLAWLLTGFGLLGVLTRRRNSRFKVEEIVVYSVHRSFFLWAMILTGFVASAALRHHGNPVLWGWIYIWVLLYTLLTLLFDLSSLKFLLWTGILAFAWILSKYLEELRHLTVLSYLVGYLRALHPKLDAGMASVLSWLLIGPWIGALFHSFSRGRKVFSPNSIEEWYFGEGREITDRSGLKFRSRYRDILETTLGLGSGDLEAIDGNGVVVKRWENIIFLLFIWNRLDEILHQRSAVVDNAPEDPVEVEAIRRNKTA